MVCTKEQALETIEDIRIIEAGKKHFKDLSVSERMEMLRRLVECRRELELFKKEYPDA